MLFSSICYEIIYINVLMKTSNSAINICEYSVGMSHQVKFDSWF